MANNIQLAEKFVPIIDEIYKKASLTAVLDATTQVDFTGTNTVKIMKIDTTALGDYSKENGYPDGDVTVTWEALQLMNDRAKSFSIDRMDNEETLGQAFGGAMGNFMTAHVAPETDAYRFSAYAKRAGGKATGTLADGEAVVKAVRAAITAMDEAEVPLEDRILFITPTMYGLVQDLDTTKSKEVFKRVSAVVEVPQTRFNSDIVLNSGASDWGYTANGNDINFMVVSKSAIVQAKKLALPKIFDPDTNQDKDAWKFQFRLYHDAFVLDNKVNGIYVHTKA